MKCIFTASFVPLADDLFADSDLGKLAAGGTVEVTAAGLGGGIFLSPNRSDSQES